MTRKMHQGMYALGLTLGLLLAGSGFAQAENGAGLYTVHATTGRVTIADQGCGGNSLRIEESCGLNYEIINANRLARILCDSGDERLPARFTLATFIACDYWPDVMIGVWDVLNQERVCGSLSLYTMAAASREGRNRGKAELLLVTEDSFPLYASATGRFGPLPKKFEMEQTCWSNYETGAISGALSPETVITGGTLRGGGVIGIYGNFAQ